MKRILFILLTIATLSVKCQEVFPSNTYVRTCLSDIECSSINSSSFLFYDNVKGKFYIKIDFNLLKTGIDSVDFWLEDLNDTYYYFKASLPQENLPHMGNYSTKNLRLAGQAFLNGIWKPQTIDVTVFRAESDMMTSSSNADDHASTRVNFNFSISPKNFNIHKKPQHLSNTIFIGVSSGRINILRPGTEGLLGEAYDHN